MPLYDFRCPKCGLEFEVSRPINRASEAAICPQDGTESERVFTMPMTFIRGSGDASAPASPTADFGGHGHDPGPGGHSHGPGSHTH